MTVTIDDVLAWDPATLECVAEALNAHRRTLLGLQDELDTGAPPASWLHVAAERARTNHRRLDARILDLATEVRAVAVAIDVVTPTLRRAQQLIASQLAFARDHGFTVDHATLTVTPPADPADDGTAELQQVRAQGIADELARALATAREVDLDVAGTLEAAASAGYDGGTGSLTEAMSQLPHLEGDYAEATRLARRQAGVDAAMLGRSLEAGLDAGALAASTRLLDRINERLDAGERLSASEAAYVATWVDTLGAERLASLADRVTDLVGVLHAGEPDHAREQLVRARLAPVADAILSYSNPHAHQSDSGVAQHTSPEAGPPRSFITLAAMPAAIRALTSLRLGLVSDSGARVGVEPGTRPGGGATGATVQTVDQHQFDDVRGYDAFGGWARLLDSASEGVEGGDRFSRDLAEQAIQAKQDLNAIAETAESHPEQYQTLGRGGYGDTAELDLERFNDDGISTLLSVAARNEDGASNVLLDLDSRRALLQLNWNDATGAQELVAAGTDRDPTTGTGHPARQAEAALAVMSDVARDPVRWQELTGEPMTDAIVDVGIRWRDTFGEVSTTVSDVRLDGVDALERPVGPAVQLVDDDLRGFLAFAASAGDHDAVRFHASLIDNGDRLVRAALDGDHAGDLRAALTWAGHAEGRMTEVHIDLARDPDEAGNDREVAEIIARNREIAAHKMMASVATSLAGSGVAPIPVAGPALSAGINAFSRPVLDQAFVPHEVPDYTEIEHEHREAELSDARLAADAERDHRFARLVWDRVDPADYPRLHDETGGLRPLEALQRDVDSLGQLARLTDSMLDDWNRRHPDDVTLADEYDAALRAHLEGAAVDAERHDPSLDDDKARRSLYGDYDIRTRVPSSLGPGARTHSALELEHARVGRE